MPIQSVLVAASGHIVAASISATVVLIGLFLTLRENRKLQRERAAADIALAERKFEFDRDLVDHRRKVELAEQALSLVSEVRDVIVSARSPGIRGGEGKTRERNGREDEEVANRRDTYFVPIERLHRDIQVFSRLQSLRYFIAAYFGDQAATPFVDLLKARAEIISAAHILIECAPAEDRGVPENPTLRRIAFATGEQPDRIAQEVDAAVAALEAICTPILRRRLGQEVA